MRLKYALMLVTTTSMLLSCQDENELVLNENLKASQVVTVPTGIPAPKAPTRQKLASVSLFLSKVGDGSGTVTVNIFRKAGKTHVGSATIDVSDVHGWTTFAFPSPISLMEGQRYLIELVADTDVEISWYEALDDYPHGIAMEGDRALQSHVDFAFRTFKEVTVPAGMKSIKVRLLDQTTSYDDSRSYVINGPYSQEFVPGAAR